MFSYLKKNLNDPSPANLKITLFKIWVWHWDQTMGLVTLSLSCHIVIYYVSVTLSWYRAQLVEADEAFTSLGLYCYK